MRGKTWRTWTEKDQLEELRLQGLTAQAIAAALGRTLASVRCRLTAEQILRPSSLYRWLPVLECPHTIAGAAAAMGTTKLAAKQAKRRLRLAGFEIPAAPPELRYAMENMLTIDSDTIELIEVLAKRRGWTAGQLITNAVYHAFPALRDGCLDYSQNRRAGAELVELGIAVGGGEESIWDQRWTIAELDP